MPAVRDYGDHLVDWAPDGRTITITPKYRNASTTIKFGLGNAEIQINVSNPPTEIVKPITDETTMEGLLPTSPYKLKKWRAGAVGGIVQKTLTGFNGWSRTIEYFEASDFKMEEVTASDMTEHNYGKETFYTGRGRLSW